jgi:hypothetical protein
MMTEDQMRELLATARVIAVVGHSNSPYRPSYQIAQYLRQAGYTVYPVNPKFKDIDGQTCYPNLAAVPEPIDIVDVFRRAEQLEDVVQEALDVGAKAVWGQLGISNKDAKRLAEQSGMPLVMDTCIRVMHLRLIVNK